MRILLTEQMDWRVPGKRAFVHFTVGEHVMTRDQAAEAIRLGKGAEVKRDGK